ncbi:MAG: hypothetical protein DRG69_09635, partial [Deltaproteobacteria bacterium]
TETHRSTRLHRNTMKQKLAKLINNCPKIVFITDRASTTYKNQIKARNRPYRTFEGFKLILNNTTSHRFSACIGDEGCKRVAIDISNLSSTPARIIEFFRINDLITC